MIGFALRHWKWGVIGGLVAALTWQTVALKSEQAGHARTRATLEKQVSDYRAAAETARANAERQRADAIARQQKVTENVTIDYEQRIADLRQRYDGLRQQSEGDPRAAGGSHLPAIPDATCQPDAAALNSGFLAILEAADENTERLIGLQDWVRGQVGTARE